MEFEYCGKTCSVHYMEFCDYEENWRGRCGGVAVAAKTKKECIEKLKEAVSKEVAKMTKLAERDCFGVEYRGYEGITYFLTWEKYRLLVPDLGINEEVPWEEYENRYAELEIILADKIIDLLLEGKKLPRKSAKVVAGNGLLWREGGKWKAEMFHLKNTVVTCVGDTKKDTEEGIRACLKSLMEKEG